MIFVIGLTNNVLYILCNFPTVVWTPRRGIGCKHGVYVYLIVIDQLMYTKI